MDIASIFNKNFTVGKTAFRRIDFDGVRVESCGGRKVLLVEPEALRILAREAFRDVNFLLRTSHLEGWAAVLDDPAASANDRFVAATLLKNAALSAEGILPLCQDTGTATVVGLKGESVFTGVDDVAELTAGIRETYSTRNLRFSQNSPLSMFAERNTGDNLPAQIDIYAAPGEEYQFLFVAKGGGSSNKTSLFQETKALLNEESFTKFLREKVKALGVAGCPPYHLGLVVGGTSPEFNLKMLKLATTGALDLLPERADGSGEPYRDREWEERLLRIATETGLGAQFGGKYLALSARVIRCSRHGGSCPVSLGVSCSAHRNALARITAEGIFLEEFDREPARFLPKSLEVLSCHREGEAPAEPRELQSQSTLSTDRLEPRPPMMTEDAGAEAIDLDRPMSEVCQSLSRLQPGAMTLLTGTMIVARDAAHARFYELLKQGRPLPEYLLKHPIYYAGPAETPPGFVIGSFGPTTAQRMDGYLAEFMARGASLVTLAKGNRSAAVTEACKAHGGFYLGTIGGAAALLAKENIVASEILDYADLGMEAVRRIRVKNLPAFLVVDDKGNNFYR